MYIQFHVHANIELTKKIFTNTLQCERDSNINYVNITQTRD